MRPAGALRNHRLRAAIIDSGLSYTAVAALVRTVAAENGEVLRTNSANVTQWAGGAKPKPRTALYLAEALTRACGRLITSADLGLGSPHDVPAVTGDPVTDLAHLGRLDVDRRGFLTTVFSLPMTAAVPAPVLSDRARSAARRGTIGRAEVATVREVVHTFTRADERLGGGAGRSPLAEYLATDATTYLRGRFANSTVRADMYGAVAELARLAGFKAHDAGREELAQRYYLHAWQLARESDPAHAAFVLRLMAHQAIDLGHGRACIHLAEAARTAGRGRVDVATMGQFNLALARTHAAAGAAQAARAALAEAEDCINTHTPNADRPWWALAMGAPEPLLTTHTAKTLRALGDPAVEQQLRESVHRWDADTHPRVRALQLCELGRYHAERGHIGYACQAWHEALQLLNGVDSERARTAVTGIRTALSPFRRRGAADATRLDQMAARWQQEATSRT
ncbi:tetratricopeptide repeat protein [Actinomadura viridis]|uniref:tetratricopeptide repeat protein n=1 Tax=Actinomadura viridis TaxID=58110 RepID=UPI0036754837